MAQNNIPAFEISQFSFTSEDQATDWKKFYTNVIDYLEALNIDPEREDQEKKGWKQIKIMFKGDDRQALQILIENGTISQADQCTPIKALKAIQTTLKDEENYWQYRDDILSDIRQHPEEQVHTLNTRITELVNKCNFQHQETRETVKIMLLHHAIKYHEARDWIRFQDPTTLTYTTLLNHCKMLEQRCKHYRKAQINGRAQLTSLARATSHSSIHQDAIMTQQQRSCHRCGYNHLRGDFPAIGQRCNQCNSRDHFAAVCTSRGHRNYRREQNDDRQRYR